MKTRIAALILSCCLASVCHAEQKKIPRDGSETAIIRLKADPRKYAGSVITVVGGIAVGDYYNYSYERTDAFFYSLRFREAGNSFSDKLGGSLTLYLHKRFGEPIVEKILEDAEKAKDEMMILVRVKAKLNPQRYLVGKQWDMLEVVDVQFYDYDTETWGEWMVETAEAAKKKIEDEQQAKQKAEDDKKAAKQKANDKARAELEEKAKNERAAEGKLKLAQAYLKDGKKEKYRQTLTDLVERYPGTKAAQKAKDLLK